MFGNDTLHTNHYNSCCLNSYKEGFVACNNGKVFGYSSEQKKPKCLEKVLQLYLTRTILIVLLQIQAPCLIQLGLDLWFYRIIPLQQVHP